MSREWLIRELERDVDHAWKLRDVLAAERVLAEAGAAERRRLERAAEELRGDVDAQRAAHAATAVLASAHAAELRRLQERATALGMAQQELETKHRAVCAVSEDRRAAIEEWVAAYADLEERLAAALKQRAAAPPSPPALAGGQRLAAERVSSPAHPAAGGAARPAADAPSVAAIIASRARKVLSML